MSIDYDNYGNSRDSQDSNTLDYGNYNDDSINGRRKRMVMNVSLMVKLATTKFKNGLLFMELIGDDRNIFYWDNNVRYVIPLEVYNIMQDKELDKLVTYETQCPHCGKMSIHLLRLGDLLEWQKPTRTRLIHQIFDYLSDEEREELITGTCEDCWDKIWEKNND